jgi:predicted DNA binding CopG/RHH family protein
MKKKSVKNLKIYKKVKFDPEVVTSESKKYQIAREKKKPTSVALDEETIVELKKIAEKRGIPYQVLMRSYIIEGLRKDKKSA